MLSAYGDVNSAVRAMKAGAVDFLEKPFRGQELLECINRALALDTRQREEQFKKQAFVSRLDALTPGEREVLDLMVAGCTYKEIASKLNLSYKAARPGGHAS
jgi:FixJ family two-component response regulator